MARTSAALKKPVEEKRPLGVRVTSNEHRLIADAAKRERRSLNSFVVQAAVRAAEETQRPRRKTPEEMKEVFRTMRAELGVAARPGHDLLEDFLRERRQEAARE